MALKAQFKTRKTVNDARGAGGKKPDIRDLVDMMEFPDKKWVKIRLVGPLVSYGGHWIETKTKEGKPTKFWKQCLAYDSDSEARDSTKQCPYCEDDSGKIGLGDAYYTNAIVRSLQEDKPEKPKKANSSEKESGFKEKSSESWTPVRVVRLTGSVVRELKRLGSLNKHKNKKTGESQVYPISHERNGVDVKIMYDKDEKTPAKKYTIQIGETRTPLEDEETEYLLWDIEELIKPEKLEEAKKEYDRWLEKMGLSAGKKKKKDDDEDEDDDEDSDSDDDEDDDEDEGKSKKKKKKKKDDDDEDDDDEDSDSDDDDDDEDEKSKKKKKKKDDDDDDDDEEDEEDEDEKPKKKKKKKDDDDEDDEDESDDDDEDEGKKKKKKKKDDDDDDDDDLDIDDDEDDDEDEGKKKKKKKKDDDDDEDEDEDEEDEPKKKKKKKKDDDDDEDEDEDDDEEDEPKKKKKKKKDDDDEDDDDDEF